MREERGEGRKKTEQEGERVRREMFKGGEEREERRAEREEDCCGRGNEKGRRHRGKI
jgi:hypothetical protein